MDNLYNLDDVFYVILTKSFYNGTEGVSYLMLVNDGHMIQSNLYDASKFCDKCKAHEQKIIVEGVFPDREFNVVPVDKRIFGPKPRFVEV